jgi:hypothetical protein
MDTSVVIVQSMAGFTGNLELTAPGFNGFVTGTWSDDEKTLTIAPAAQFPYATFTWKLNPPGVFDFLTIKSKAGVALATVSGTFSTGVGGGDPKLGSSFPLNGAVGVETNVQVEFRFDQAMKTNISFSGNPGPVAWGGLGIDAPKFVYSWSADKKTLYASYTGGFPRNTFVTWALNPSAAAVKLEGENGKFLASDTYSGQFITSNGEPECTATGFPTNWGSYGISKRSNYRQTSTADPLPDTLDGSFVFSASVLSPSLSAGVTGSVTKPSNMQYALSGFGGFAQYLETAASEAALDAAAPAGSYTLRFTLAGQTEQVSTMSMASQAPPVPKITNFDEAQNINPSTDFTLRWNGFSGAGPDDHINMYISDTNGNVVFQAPNLCVPRELPVTATSILIPANTIRSNQTYSAALQYGRLFYFSTNAVPEMVGYGDLVRNTFFSLKTQGSGGVPPTAPRFTTFELLPNGNPRFTVTGTAGATYSVQRTQNLTSQSWETIGNVTIPADGGAVFEDTQSGKSFPLFYRLSGS